LNNFDKFILVQCGDPSAKPIRDVNIERFVGKCRRRPKGQKPSKPARRKSGFLAKFAPRTDKRRFRAVEFSGRKFVRDFSYGVAALPYQNDRSVPRQSDDRRGSGVIDIFARRGFSVGKPDLIDIKINRFSQMNRLSRNFGLRQLFTHDGIIAFKRAWGVE